MKLSKIKEDHVKILSEVFKSKFNGRKNADTGNNILLYLSGTGQAVMNAQAFREALGEVRRRDILKPAYVISNQNIGYWLSSDIKELNDFVDQELSRMGNQFSNIEPLHRRIKHNKEKKPKKQTSLF